MRQHYRHGRVAYDDAGASENAGWFGDSRIFQRCAGNVCDRVIVPEGETEGEIITPRFGDIAANAVRAGRYAWHSRLDEPRSGPTLRFSTGPETLPGFEGAVAANADVSVVLALDKRLVRVIKGGITVRTVQLPGGVFGDPWIDSTGTWLVAACFRASGGPKLTLVNIQTGTVMADPVCLTKANHYAAACVALGPDAEDVFIAYLTDEFGLVIHPAYDPTRRRLLSPKGAGVWGTDLCILEDAPNAVSIVWANTGERGFGPERRESITIEDLRALPSVPVPAPVVEPPAPPPPPPPPMAKPFGATSAPSPKGLVVDVNDYFIPEPRLTPRDGTHYSHQHVVALPNGRILLYWVKFSPAEFKGQRGEVWMYEPQQEMWHLLGDWSNATGFHGEDTRWCPRYMRVGDVFQTTQHNLIERDRACREVGRRVHRLKMSIEHYPSWYFGPHIGERPALVLTHDPTDGIPGAKRGIEKYVMPFNGGPARWDYYRSDYVREDGGFSERARESRSDFYLVTGDPVVPDFPRCLPEPYMAAPPPRPVDPPTPPPVDPPPPPPIDPPAPPVEPPPLPPALTGEAGYTQAAEEAAARLLRDAREGK